MRKPLDQRRAYADSFLFDLCLKANMKQQTLETAAEIEDGEKPSDEDMAAFRDELSFRALEHIPSAELMSHFFSDGKSRHDRYIDEAESASLALRLLDRGYAHHGQIVS